MTEAVQGSRSRLMSCVQIFAESTLADQRPWGAIRLLLQACARVSYRVFSFPASFDAFATASH